MTGTRRAIFATLLWSVVASANAGASFRVDVEFAPIKSQIPGLWRSLVASFDLAGSGSASMIGNTVNARLGHRRVGPYCLHGKPKDQPGRDTLLFCFHTESLWLDEKGNASTLPEAHAVKETFMSLEVTLLKPATGD
jgi:hypothetical protein